MTHTERRQARNVAARLVAEFAVIVLGVLVALAVDDWSQYRRDRALERSLLDRMEAELRNDARDLAQAEYNARARLWVLDAVLAELGDGQAAARLGPARLDSLLHPARLDSLQGMPNRVGRRSRDLENQPLGVFRNRGNFDLSKAAYEEMISTGAVRILRDDELRASVMAYYRVAEDIGANEERDTYYEQIEEALASIGVAPGDDLSIPALAARARSVPAFPVAVRRVQNRIRGLIRYYALVESTRRSLEEALSEHRDER